jgi:hypothetical protein
MAKVSKATSIEINLVDVNTTKPEILKNIIKNHQKMWRKLFMSNFSIRQ